MGLAAMINIASLDTTHFMRFTGHIKPAPPKPSVN
jgi:hypothetical protein